MANSLSWKGRERIKEKRNKKRKRWGKKNVVASWIWIIPCQMSNFKGWDMTYLRFWWNFSRWKLYMRWGNTEIFLGGGSMEKCNHNWSSTHKKQLGICIVYTYISELMLLLHQGKFVNIKWVKILSLAALEVDKYVRTVK